MHCSLMVDINGYELENVEKAILSNPLVGAVILFARNYSNSIQLTALIQQLRAIKPTIIIAVDQEGGNIQRFQRYGFRSLPSLRALGELYDASPEIGLQEAYRYGHIMARELLGFGIDLSLAPVIDLHDDNSEIIGGLDRAFHRDPLVVAELAEAYIDGMNSAGMLATAKHFPGHGSQADSHLTKPVDDVSYEELLAADLTPFKLLIAKGKLHAVMPAHITNIKIDKSNPVGYSAIWLQDILRKNLKFKGLIISDCLSMAGADIGDLETRAQRAFSAGCNMAIVANQPRGVLLALLQFLQPLVTQRVDPYLREFIVGISRFKAHALSKPSLLPVSTTSLCKDPRSVAIKPDPLNRTTGI